MEIKRKDFKYGAPGHTALAESHMAMNKWLKENTSESKHSDPLIKLLNVETLHDVSGPELTFGNGGPVTTQVVGVRLWYTEAR